MESAIAGIRQNSVASINQRLQERISGIQVVQDCDLCSHVVRQVVELPPAADRHKDASGALLHCHLHHRNGVEDGLERTTKVQTPGDNQPPLYVLLQER